MNALDLAPSGNARHALAEDYQRMVEDGLLLDGAEPIDALLQLPGSRREGERHRAEIDMTSSSLATSSQSSSRAVLLNLDRNNLGAGPKFVEVVGPQLQHVPTLQEKLRAVVGTPERVFDGMRQLGLDHRFVYA